MKILVYGAGVIGCVYAAKLHESAYDVALLARGNRYEKLKQDGVIIRDILTGKQITSTVNLVSQLATNDFYDLIVVTVRLDQVETVVPALKNNKASRLIMFMLNYPRDINRLTNELPNKHVILGFPGIGGTYKDNLIEYLQIKQQNTTIGELDGGVSMRIKAIKTFFEFAGFRVSISSNMPDWLKTHAVFVACVAASISKENGYSIQLGKKRNSVAIMVKSICEGFKALKALGVSIEPVNLKIIFLIMPQWFSVFYWQRAMQSEIGTLAIAPHANAAKTEMQVLAGSILAIIRSSRSPAPTLDKLLSDFQLPRLTRSHLQTQ